MRNAYVLAKLLPVVESSYTTAPDDNAAKERAADFLRGQPAGGYLLVTTDPDYGKHVVVATYEVKTTTNVAEILARFQL